MSPRRLYLDNAATSFPKPPGVAQAMAAFANDVGASAGRGAYAPAIEAAYILHTCRRRVNQLINGEGANQVVFTLNGTDALNLAIKGALTADRPLPTAHCVCTDADHNAVLRPLAALAARNEIELTHVPIDPKTARVDPDAVRRAIRPNTRLIV